MEKTSQFSFKVGDKFESFEVLRKRIEAEEEKLKIQFVLRDCRKLSAAAKRYPRRVENAKQELVYYNLHYTCAFGGKPFKSQGTGLRSTKTYKVDCKAGFKLSLSEDRNHLVITEVHEEHSHDIQEVTSWKTWRQEKKLLHRKWKEEKVIKKLEKKKKKENTESIEKKKNISEGRHYTISIAVPGSIIDNAQTAELRTYLAGQIGRAATIFHVDEIVVFDETGTLTHSEKEMALLVVGDKGYSNIQLSRILQYLECPQYLRKDIISLHPDLKFAGLLNPLDAPHHLRASDTSLYRDGVVLKRPPKKGKGSYVKIGLAKEVQIDKALEAGTRVTVRLEPAEEATKHLKGVAVPPSAPRTDAGLYWGYNVRLASNVIKVVTESPFKDGYDLVIGTSDKGDSVDDTVLPSFKHLLVVFGGLGGLEACLDSEEMSDIENPRSLFPYYLNMCPNQGSRTIRTEEAIFITLSALRPKILKCHCER